MEVSDLTLIGWIHSLTCLVALAAGAFNLAAEKGTALHRRVGSLYFWSMIVVNVSAFGVYRFDVWQFKPLQAGPHVFGLFHWFAVITLGFIFIGRYAVSRQDRAVWAYVHPTMMILSYYMLIGGGINEVFVRVDVLRALAFPPGTPRVFGGSPVIGLTQTAGMAATLLMLVYFTAKVALHRRRARAVA